jgi:hypothetical protein
MGKAGSMVPAPGILLLIYFVTPTILLYYVSYYKRRSLFIAHYSLVVHYSSRINIEGYQKMRLMPRHHSCNQLLIDIGLAAIIAQSHVSHPSSYLGHY